MTRSPAPPKPRLPVAGERRLSLTPRTAAHAILAVFDPVAARHRTVPEHWVGGEADQSEGYCRRCCERMVREIKKAEPEKDVHVDGGWRMDADGMQFCCNDKCGRPLDVSFTDYAVESELDHFDGYPFDPASPDDCYSLIEMMNATPWQGGKHSPRVRRLAFRALRGVGRRTLAARLTKWARVVSPSETGSVAK